jgi:hypothetical protein
MNINIYFKNSLENDDKIINVDSIFNLENQYIKKVTIGKFAICEIPDNNLKNIIDSCENNIFLHTRYKEWLWLKNKKIYTIDTEKQIKNVWICKIISFDDMINMSIYKNIITEDDKIYFNSKEVNIECIKIIYGRCLNSMNFLDKVYRDYVYRHKFRPNEIVAIKSVAGSGKTTTLLELAKIHKDKKILYIAFNKSLITEIRSKIADQKIKNLYPSTFDALMRDVFITKKQTEINIFDLKPQTLGYIIDWFKNKPYKIKNFYVKNFIKFCNQTKYSNIKEFSKKILGDEKKLLSTMWEKVLKNELTTFDTIRKIIEIDHLCKDYIDNKYDMIFIDESQDFDNTMLKILLEDTTLPKLFVGDPKQAIYEWKGCINAFDKLPDSAMVIEFYSTFRVGEPACEEIRKKFDNCWMISKSKNNTVLQYNIIPEEKYVYLFRSWKGLLQNAQNIPNIWIYNFDSQIDFIKKLHSKLQISKLEEDDLNDFSDDLPKFLLKLSLEDLEKLINDIERNIVNKDECDVEMYTIHSYKGLESNIVRIFNDIDITREQNLYYVALTRGMKNIIIDSNNVLYEKQLTGKKQTCLLSFGVGNPNSPPF